jgi:regulator of sirC expression with transglutaminase-like and TPR domain
VAATSGKELFVKLMQLPDEKIDLGIAALLIAEEEYPELDRERYLAMLDDIGAEARSRISGAGTPAAVVERLSAFLGGDLGFSGNQDDYYDPRNSFLNDVLERRTGIPISLSTVYIEAGRRAGLNMQGVGFPAHFLAKYVPPDGAEVVFDAFDGGRILSVDDCRVRLAELSDGSIEFRPAYVAAMPTKQIAQRMLNNLKSIYVDARYYRKAIGIIDRLLVIDPGAYQELRDRGAMHVELKQFAHARSDLETYLQRCKEGDDVAGIRQALRVIDDVVTMMDE